MSSLSVAGLGVDLGGRRVLREVDLEVSEGALAVIVGPSGCGKSTLLRAVAGLNRPVAGRVRLDGATLSDESTFVVPERRRVGWVPQAASLFPHLTVAQNVAFGLSRERRRADGSGRAGLAQELLELTGLGDLAARYPDQLSGGQAQRVALARALAAEPGLLLLDEPFAALDPQLRADLRDELSAMLRRLGVTAVLVTHDQAEALLIADTVIVMRDGGVAQQAGPEDVYRRPSSAWVAGFFGEANFVDAVAVAERASTPLGDVVLDRAAHGAVTVMLRPEQLVLSRDGMRGVVTRVRYGGHDAIVEVRDEGDRMLLTRVPAGRIPAVGHEVFLQVEGTGVVYESPGR